MIEQIAMMCSDQANGECGGIVTARQVMAHRFNRWVQRDLCDVHARERRARGQRVRRLPYGVSA